MYDEFVTSNPKVGIQRYRVINLLKTRTKVVHKNISQRIGSEGLKVKKYKTSHNIKATDEVIYNFMKNCVSMILAFINFYQNQSINKCTRIILA